MTSRKLFVIAGTWLALAVAIAVGVSYEARNRQARSFARAYDTLHLTASQRADQHDAHLTALSAIASGQETLRPDLFLDVAATIRRFYPRIDAVDLVPFAAGGLSLSTRAAIDEAIQKNTLNAARQSDGPLVLVAAETPGRYLLVKRSPNSDAARFGLALEIDGAALLHSGDGFWQKPTVAVGLGMPDGTALLPVPAEGAFALQKTLGSASQPLVLQARFSPSAGDLFPVAPILALIGLMSVVLAGVVLQRSASKRLHEARASAELSAQETRLAHASRVNSMGEMASGLAHEVTQPLTAILSQSQAGLHLARSGTDGAAIEGILSDNIEQARRASAILERLRNWSRPVSVRPEPVSLNAAADGVNKLMAADLRAHGIALTLSLDPDIPEVHADPVELEQVIFNLARNARDALLAAGRNPARIAIETGQKNGRVTLEVTDNGPGVPPDLRESLFDPFVSGTDGGTGLGLALCQRLVERMGGEIAVDPPAAGGARFRITLPAVRTKGAS